MVVFLQNSASEQGGGLLVLADELTMVKSQVVGNVAPTSGGIYARVNTLTMDDCLVSDNIGSRGDFGGLYVEGADVALIRSTTFQRNKANSGGGLSGSSCSSLSVFNCTLLDNYANAKVGGAVLLITSSFTVADSTFTSNSAVHDGGGVHVSDMDNMTIRNCQFVNNSAVEGSG
ncbi:unnamed protein product, partial [Ectocarpus fasciculatus]